MTKVILFSLSLYLASCSGHNGQSVVQTHSSYNPAYWETYVWTKLSDSAEWRKSYNFQMLSIRDTLWTFHYDGNWYSTDGKNWAKSTLPNSIGNLAFVDYVQFKNAVYGIGHFEGNIERFILKNEIYKTTDLRHWETVSKESNLPKRFFYHPFVFNNQIWIIGGQDKNAQYDDIWNSSDGIKWVKQKENLPFGKRSRSQVVQLNNKLFLLDNDVWSSADALSWHKETGAILKGENIFGYTAVVFDNKIWLLGCNRNGRFFSQVLVSSDGKEWKTQDAPWSPRGATAATVYKNKIYLTGGKYGGFAQNGATSEFVYSNDIWTLEKK